MTGLQKLIQDVDTESLHMLLLLQLGAQHCRRRERLQRPHRQDASIPDQCPAQARPHMLCVLVQAVELVTKRRTLEDAFSSS